MPDLDHPQTITLDTALLAVRRAFAFTAYDNPNQIGCVEPGSKLFSCDATMADDKTPCRAVFFEQLTLAGLHVKDAQRELWQDGATLEEVANFLADTYAGQPLEKLAKAA